MKLIFYSKKIIVSYNTSLKKTLDVSLLDINFAIFLELNSFFHRKNSMNLIAISSFLALITLVMEFIYIIKEVS